MDNDTLSAYDRNAANFAERYNSIAPMRLYDLAKGFFQPGGETADIGCGSGRDTTWLSNAGYPTVGYDASENMLSRARATFPQCTFIQDSLPDLQHIDEGRFTNVFCSAVLMHLHREDLITASINLARILRPEGRLILSYRESQEVGEREADGRLFSPIPSGKLILLLESVGFRVLHSESQSDCSRPDVSWMVIIAEKGPLDRSRGLERIQSILVQDAKTATYKLALIRALCHIARNQSHLVKWHDGSAYIPMWSVAVE